MSISCSSYDSSMPSIANCTPGLPSQLWARHTLENFVQRCRCHGCGGAWAGAGAGIVTATSRRNWEKSGWKTAKSRRRGERGSVVIYDDDVVRMHRQCQEGWHVSP